MSDVVCGGRHSSFSFFLEALEVTSMVCVGHHSVDPRVHRKPGRKKNRTNKIKDNKDTLLQQMVLKALEFLFPFLSYYKCNFKHLNVVKTDMSIFEDLKV